jgi:hypothetical protein
VQGLPGGLSHPRAVGARASIRAAGGVIILARGPIVARTSPAREAAGTGQDRSQLPGLRPPLSAGGETGREAGPLYGVPRGVHDPDAVIIDGPFRAESRAIPPRATERSGSGPVEVVSPDRAAGGTAPRSEAGARDHHRRPHPG